MARWVVIEQGPTKLYLPAILNGNDDGTTLPTPTRSPDEIAAQILRDFEPLSLDVAEVPLDAAAVEKLMWYVNKARQTYGLQPLTYVFELSAAAQAHTLDMAANGFTSHTGSDGSRPPLRQATQWLHGLLRR